MLNRRQVTHRHVDLADTGGLTASSVADDPVLLAIHALYYAIANKLRHVEQARVLCGTGTWRRRRH